MAASTAMCAFFPTRHSTSRRRNWCFGAGGAAVTVRGHQMKTEIREAPWLTLPPVFEGGDLVYKFYKLKDGVVESIPKRRRNTNTDVGFDFDFDLDLPPDDAKLVGSSHGWLAFYDETSTHVFLSNPITRRHIKLPRIDTLPNPEFNMFGGDRRTISRVILSSSPSPEADGTTTCRAITTFGPSRRLASCVPGLSTEWNCAIDLIDVPLDFCDFVEFAEQPKEDFVYCAQRGVLTSISPLEFCFHDSDLGRVNIWKEGVLFGNTEEGDCSIWDWDLVDPHLDEIQRIWELDEDRAELGELWNGEAKQHLKMLSRECFQIPHIFYAEDLSPVHPFILLRFVHRGIGCNGSPPDPKLAHPHLYRGMIDTFPYKTVSFLLFQVDFADPPDKQGWGVDPRCRVVKDLRGLAVFVGMNHSFAIPAADFPGILKPNSIYFTDACRMFSDEDDLPDATKIYGGHDIGVFHYDTNTISPCHYPCDVQNFQRIDPPPMWFTPNPKRLPQR